MAAGRGPRTGVNAANFAAALAALGVPAGEPFAVAVSGGSDSLALLFLAHAALPTRVRALTVDHRLRAAAAGEAATVAATCARLGVPHATLGWDGDKPAANIQAAAREARYALMGAWCAANGVPWLLTAHHVDDQAETLLMRLARGSGSGGLAGIRARRPLVPGVTLVRPLLDVRRDDLGNYLRSLGEVAVSDPANSDGRYDRTAARALLAVTPWLDTARLAAAAANLAQVEAALAWTAGLAWDSRAEIAADRVTVDAAGLPAELCRRLAGRALAHFGDTPDGPRLDRMVAALTAGSSATLGQVQGQGGDRWTFRRVQPRVAG